MFTLASQDSVVDRLTCDTDFEVAWFFRAHISVVNFY